MRLLICLFVFIACSANRIHGQIIAGDTSGLIQGLASINLGQSGGPLPTDIVLSDSLDLNDDGIRDVDFEVWIYNAIDGNGSAVSLYGRHPGFSFIMGPQEVKRYVAGDTISGDTNWSAPLISSLFVYKQVNITGQALSGGEWLAGSLGYAGFRLITPDQDTLHGWIRVNASSFGVNGAALQVSRWAIEHTPAPAYANITVSPRKDVYCKGDSVLFTSAVFGYDEVVWHFWDGATDTSLSVTRILPDTTVSVTLEATGPGGSTSKQVTLTVSPLALFAQNDTISCAFPLAVLTAQTNVFADIYWQTDTGLVAGASFETDQPGLYQALAVDSFGCTATATAIVWADQAIPGDLNIQFDESSQQLIASTASPGAVYLWQGETLPEPVPGNILSITQSGTYTVMATLPNGCTTTASIQVIISADSELLTERVRIAPNPAGEALTVTGLPPAVIRIEVIDPEGRRALSREAISGNTFLLDASVLSAGLYWLTGYGAGGSLIFIEKFIKM